MTSFAKTGIKIIKQIAAFAIIGLPFVFVGEYSSAETVGIRLPLPPGNIFPQASVVCPHYTEFNLTRLKHLDSCGDPIVKNIGHRYEIQTNISLKVRNDSRSQSIYARAFFMKDDDITSKTNPSCKINLRLDTDNNIDQNNTGSCNEECDFETVDNTGYGFNIEYGIILDVTVVDTSPNFGSDNMCMIVICYNDDYNCQKLINHF